MVPHSLLHAWAHPCWIPKLPLIPRLPPKLPLLPRLPLPWKMPPPRQMLT